jgi:hypothetical protein
VEATKVMVSTVQGYGVNGEGRSKELSCIAWLHALRQNLEKVVIGVGSTDELTETRMKCSQSKIAQQVHQGWRLAAEMRSSSYGKSELWVNRVSMKQTVQYRGYLSFDRYVPPHMR